jgi:hypothetical protein
MFNTCFNDYDRDFPGHYLFCKNTSNKEINPKTFVDKVIDDFEILLEDH